MARAALSEGASEYRRAMWMLAIVGLVALGSSWLAVRGLASRGLGILGFSVGTTAVALSAWFGVRARQQALRDQEIAARRSMLVMLTAQLGHQDDATLARIVQKGGPAGEAASLILKGRRERSRPS